MKILFSFSQYSFKLSRLQITSYWERKYSKINKTINVNHYVSIRMKVHFREKSQVTVFLVHILFGIFSLMNPINMIGTIKLLDNAFINPRLILCKIKTTITKLLK